MHSLKGESGPVSAISQKLNGSCLATGHKDGAISLWKNRLETLLLLPIASYTPERWNYIAAHQREFSKAEGWEDQWIIFLSTLGKIVRRLDVYVDAHEGESKASPFEIELDA
jgi:hypothetical protein